MAQLAVVLDLDAILAVLPHRPPMLFVDQVVEFDGENQTAIAELQITNDHCTGHFPDNSIFPGCKIIEAVGQASILLAHLVDRTKIENKAPFVISCNGVKFRRPVVPGDILRLEVGLTSFRPRRFKYFGKACVNGDLAGEVGEGMIVVS